MYRSVFRAKHSDIEVFATKIDLITVSVSFVIVFIDRIVCFRPLVSSLNLILKTRQRYKSGI